MAFMNSHLIQYYIYNDIPSEDQQHHQILEIRRYLIHRFMFGSPFQTINQTSPISLDDHNNPLSPLPLYLLHDHDPISFTTYIVQLLSTRNIDPNASEVIALEITTLVHRIIDGNPDVSFYIIAIVDHIEFAWMGSLSFPMQQPTRNEMRMERLEEIGEDLGNCSICLEGFCSNMREVVKISCGHVYHESCILNWLNNSHFCPLCRRSMLPLED